MTTSIQLSDGFILLRRHLGIDVKTAYDAVRESIPALSPWLAWCHEAYTAEEARQSIQNQDKWWNEEEVFSFSLIPGDL